MRRKWILSSSIVCVLLCFCAVGLADAGSLMWSRTYGGESWDSAQDLVESSDGGYAIAGYTQSVGAGPQDFWLVKTDASGNEEWNQTYGGNLSDRAYSVVATLDGGYALAGQTGSYRETKFDFLLVKTDSTGNIQWNQTYGGSQKECAKSLVATSDGGYVIGGHTYSFGAGEDDVWLVKLDGCMDTYEFVTYEFDFSYGYGEYVVVISTNSTVGGFDFGINQDRISFTVTGPTGTTGVAKIIIPEDLTGGEFPVYLNELMLLEDVDYTKMYNGTHTIIDMTYSQSTHTIVITGTNVVPEYTSWFIPTLLLVATLAIVIYKKELIKPRA